MLPFAYIDPGMGSMLLQVFISAVIGSVVVFRGFIARVGFWLKNKIFGGRPEKKAGDNEKKV